MKQFPVFLALLLLLLGACGDPSGVVAPERMEPLPEYAAWWTGAVNCTNRAGADLSAISWYRVRSVSAAGHTNYLAGAWEPPHTIYLLYSATGDRKVVQHEMLHDLLQGDPAHKHRCFWTLG
jgi:hypothetical protein